MTRTQQSSDQVRAVDLEMGGDDDTPGISQELTADDIDDKAATGSTRAGLDGLLDKGRRILVQAGKITYIEIGAADKGRVGFGIAAGS